VFQRIFNFDPRHSEQCPTLQGRRWRWS
jgi:hypothetical protein